MTVGENIRKYRKKRGLTQKELASLSGLNEVTIRSYEAGRYKPKIETIQRIATALDINISDISGYSEFKEALIEDSPALSALKRLGLENSDFGKDLIARQTTEKLDITEDKEKLLYNYNQLNEDGKKKALEQVEMLTKVPDYRRIIDLFSGINAALDQLGPSEDLVISLDDLEKKDEQ